MAKYRGNPTSKSAIGQRTSEVGNLTTEMVQHGSDLGDLVANRLATFGELQTRHGGDVATGNRLPEAVWQSMGVIL